MTYREISGVKESSIADAIRTICSEQGTSRPKSSRVGELKETLTLITPKRRYCGRCGRLDITRLAGQWSPATSSTCGGKPDQTSPCAGAWNRVVFDEPIDSWTDGKIRPPGSKLDDDGNPITTDGIVAHLVAYGGVHQWVSDALLANGDFPLTEWARWLLLRSGIHNAKSPAAPHAVIRSIADPSGIAGTKERLAQLVAQAVESTGKSVATTESGASKVINTGASDTRRRDDDSDGETIDIITMTKSDIVVFRRLLAKNCQATKAIREMCEEAGLDLSRIDFSGGAAGEWYSAVAEAEKSHVVTELARIAVRKYPEEFAMFVAGNGR